MPTATKISSMGFRVYCCDLKQYLEAKKVGPATSYVLGWDGWRVTWIITTTATTSQRRMDVRREAMDVSR